MLAKIARAWSFAIIGGAVIPGITLFLFVEDRFNIWELLFYSTVGLIFGAAFIPTLIALLITANTYHELDESDLRDKLTTTHLVSVLITFAAGNILISALLTGMTFFAYQIVFTLAIIAIYGIASGISWWLVFRKKQTENDDVLDQL